ncbi:MAG: hypothetical protein KZQ80_16680 [Candidatus Thiodiazotropha sp. (ex Monitilora ramsayi)]|nr:hypothetical protein [Candidatus Thiodiazotropha sp. (ex Monitilora ramsayi)]
MDKEDKKYIAEVINYFWGPNLITPDRVTEHVATVAYEALSSANSCSDAMDMVPRPTYVRPSMKYIIKQLTGIGKRVATGGSGIYYICKVVISASYEFKIKLALNGL